MRCVPADAICATMTCSKPATRRLMTGTMSRAPGIASEPETNVDDDKDVGGSLDTTVHDSVSGGAVPVSGLMGFCLAGFSRWFTEENGKAAANIAGGHPATRGNSNRLPVAVVGWMLS